MLLRQSPQQNSHLSTSYHYNDEQKLAKANLYETEFGEARQCKVSGQDRGQSARVERASSCCEIRSNWMELGGFRQRNRNSFSSAAMDNREWIFERDYE